MQVQHLDKDSFTNSTLKAPFPPRGEQLFAKTTLQPFFLTMGPWSRHMGQGWNRFAGFWGYVSPSTKQVNVGLHELELGAVAHVAA